jgi:RNA polymerase sigma-70 factor (ECF subfamily)
MHLMLRVRADEAGAFEELVRRYQHRLLGLMHHLVGDAQEAEDLVQEVYLRVYRARKTYRPEAFCDAWLFTIAENVARNRLRTRRRKPVLVLDAHDSGPLGPRPAERLVKDPGTGPQQKLDRKELAAVVRQALDGLHERQRLAVVLNKFEGLGYAEVAAMMRLSVEAVKSLLTRARLKLRDALSRYLSPDGTAAPAVDDDEQPPQAS